MNDSCPKGTSEQPKCKYASIRPFLVGASRRLSEPEDLGSADAEVAFRRSAGAFRRERNGANPRRGELNTKSTYDWEKSQWTVPLNLQVSQVLKIGPQPVQFTLGGRYYAEKPEGGPDWGLRFVVTFLFPK